MEARHIFTHLSLSCVCGKTENKTKNTAFLRVYVQWTLGSHMVGRWVKLYVGQKILGLGVISIRRLVVIHNLE